MDQDNSKILNATTPNPKHHEQPEALNPNIEHLPGGEGGGRDGSCDDSGDVGPGVGVADDGEGDNSDHAGGL